MISKNCLSFIFSCACRWRSAFSIKRVITTRPSGDPQYCGHLDSYAIPPGSPSDFLMDPQTVLLWIPKQMLPPPGSPSNIPLDPQPAFSYGSPINFPFDPQTIALWIPEQFPAGSPNNASLGPQTIFFWIPKQFSNGSPHNSPVDS